MFQVGLDAFVSGLYEVGGGVHVAEAVFGIEQSAQVLTDSAA